MTSKICLYIFCILFIYLTGCSNSLTQRGESQTQETIEDSFPDVDDELADSDTEDLSEDDFENVDQASEDSDSELNEDLDEELDESEDEQLDSDETASLDDDEDITEDELEDDFDNEDSSQASSNESNTNPITVGNKNDSESTSTNSKQALSDIENELEDFSDLDSDKDSETDLDTDFANNSSEESDSELDEDLDEDLDSEDEFDGELSDESESDSEIKPDGEPQGKSENIAANGPLDLEDEDLDFDTDEEEVSNGSSVQTDTNKTSVLDQNDLVTKNDQEKDPFSDFLSDDFGGSTNNVGSQTSEDPLFKEPEFDQQNASSNTVSEELPPSAVDFNENLDNSFEEVVKAPINDDLLNTNRTGQNKITVLEYNSQNTNGTVVIKAEQPLVFSSQFDPTTSQFILNLQNVTVPSLLQRPLYLKDFKQNFGAVKATPVSNGLVQVVIKVNNNKEPNILTNGKEILVSPGTDGIFGKVSRISESAPLNSMMNVEAEISQNLNIPTNNMSGANALTASTLEEFLLESGAFYGETINLQVSDEEIATVIGFIADYSGANIVIAPGVSGRITLKLRNVPWDQALLTIMKTRGLGYVRTGNVLRIAPLAELKTEAQDAVDVRKAQLQIEPTMLKVIPLEYASSSEILPQIQPFLTKERGTVTEDKRTSSIVINDTGSVITKVSKLIKELDLPPPQVLVEAKIVEATKNFVQSLGIRWGLGGQSTQLSSSGGQNNGAINITPTLNINRTIATDGLIQNVPFSGALNIGVLDFLGNIDAALGLSESDEQLRVISSPRVTTLNNTEATILQSSEILRERTIVNEGLSQTEVIAVPLQLQLKVTPQITSGASVLMQLNVKNEFPGAGVGARAPKNSREATARVLIESNKTAVIGGIYDKQSSIINVGVPLLKDIPFFGWLFKTKNVNKRDTEIMIFITPRILDKNYSTSASSNVN